VFLRSRYGALPRLVMILAAIGLFVAGYYWGNRFQFSGGPPVIGGVLMRPPLPLPDFSLRDARGGPFANADLEDRWTLLAFGDLARPGDTSPSPA
jgi:cytochrome oxidase Cu insertion factor (SCO1/SenC/PrrC family)